MDKCVRQALREARPRVRQAEVTQFMSLATVAQQNSPFQTKETFHDTDVFRLLSSHIHQSDLLCSFCHYGNETNSLK